MLKTIKGEDILDSTCDVIVNTVNCQGVMGKDLAKQVKDTYPQGVHNYIANAGSMKPGDVIVDEIGDVYLFHLATKDSWRNKSQIQWIRLGLQNLIVKSIEYKINSIALPPLGCGCGKLNVKDVYNELVESRIADHFEVHLYIQ